MSLDKIYQEILRKFIAENQNKIKAFLRGELTDYTKKDFNFFEFSKEFYVIVRSLKKEELNKEAIKFNLGFPFPVCTLEKKSLIKNSKVFSFYFKGESLRCEQRKILKNYFKNTKIKARWQEFTSITKFRQKFDSNIKHYHSENLLYCDPYNFIGDSFIGMHFIDGLMSKYSFTDRIIFSHSFDHLSVLGETYGYDLNLLHELFSRYHCLVLPDLLDVNFKKTLAIVSALADQSGLIIIPGRALFLKLHKGRITFFHLDKPDTILCDQNVENYMNECLFPFIESRKACQAEKFTGNKNIFFINPFGSLDNKTIDVNFVVSLCQNLNLFKKIEINIIGGLRNCSFHSKWIKEFIKLAAVKKINYKISYYSSLNQLVMDINKLRPGAILSTDTSISHLANRLNIPTIIFFHARRFDNHSLQSMISESPLGFGRYFKNSHPLLIRNYDLYLPSFIASFLLLLAGNTNIKKIAKKDFINKLNKLFPLEYFYEAMPPEKRKRIKDTLSRVSPLNKLINK